jgi:hypothetical protein
MYTFDSPWVHHPCSSQAVVEGARDGVTTTTSRHPPQNIQYAKTRHLLSTVRRRRERQLVYEHANARPTLCLTIIHWGESHLSLSLSLARAPGGPATPTLATYLAPRTPPPAAPRYAHSVRAGSDQSADNGELV